MTTLRDYLNDLITDTVTATEVGTISKERKEELIDEYVEKIRHIFDRFLEMD